MSESGRSLHLSKNDGSVMFASLQRIVMTLTRMHATGICLAATMPLYTAPNQYSQTTTNLPYDGGR